MSVKDADVEKRRATVRVALVEARDALSRSLEDRTTLVREGADLGIGATELARLAGLSRAGIYDILNREQT